MSKPFVPTAHTTSRPDHSLQPVVTPPQVWSALATDLQRRAIGLLVQLAYNQITAQAEVAVEVMAEAPAPAGAGCAPCAVPPEAASQATAFPAALGGH